MKDKLNVPDLQITVANQITTSAAITALTIEEAITNMRLAGMSDDAIRLTLVTDLKEGGILFGTFRNKLKNTVRNAVELSSNRSANQQFVKAGVKLFQWVTVNGKAVCPDCAERHGLEGTNEYFDTIGREGSGFSICQQNCRCKILPIGYKDENLDKPLVKQKN